MRSRWRALVEYLLPWFDAATERVRDARTESIRRRSIATRIHTEQIIADYKRAEERRLR